MTSPLLPDPRLGRALAHPGGKRIGTAERDRVAEALAEHYAAGRLTHEELETRTEAALQAKTAGELGVLLRDLPLLPPRPNPGPGVGRLVVEGLAGGVSAAFALLLGLISMVTFLAGEVGASLRSLLIGAVFAIGTVVAFWLLQRDRRRRRR